MSDIAVVGFSFEFPQANTDDAFWDLLLSGVCTASEFPATRLSNTKYHAARGPGRGNIVPQKACFLSRDISQFDARFFGMTPEEAEGTDPQHRMVLEHTYLALEKSGITTSSIDGSSTSVHSAFFASDYSYSSAKDPEHAPKYAVSGMAGSMLSNRLSTFFNLTGPSVTVDTACSSSLVALTLACQCLQSGNSDLGIVTGSNIIFAPDLFMSLSSLGFLSPDGVCHSFDNRANGYGRGEGVAVVILKRLDDAVRDGNTIRAVIRAAAINQNGRTSLAQPSKKLQQQLIEQAYRSASLRTSDTHYFEAHGTGTAAGDVIEAMAIGNAFGGPKRRADDPLIVGSVKANIGHLESAAGIAGLIKTILVLERGVIPPIANLEDINENIDWEYFKIQFPSASLAWPNSKLRRASINSFGFGGTNAHIILDDAYHYLRARNQIANHCTAVSPVITAPPQTTHGHRSEGLAERIFVWSANTKEALARMIDIHEKHFRTLVGDELTIPASFLDDLSKTLASNRTLQSWRSFAVAGSLQNLISQLQKPREPMLSTTNRAVGFVFTGQGAQWLGMGKELFSYEIFKRSIEEADRYLHSLGSTWAATGQSYTTEASIDAYHFTDILQDQKTGIHDINEPQFAQPVCTILQIAIVDLLESFGLTPRVVLGHSSGEIAAAYTQGAISRESAWKLAYHRGVLSGELANASREARPGAMMAVWASESALQPYVDSVLSYNENGILCIACINSPDSCTLSGDAPLVLEIQRRLKEDGISSRLLQVPVAYHSKQMTLIASGYREAIGSLSCGTCTDDSVKMVSTVTGDIISHDSLRDPDYWVRNMVSEVRFSEAATRVFEHASTPRTKKIDRSHKRLPVVTDLVEIGPHRTLQAPIATIAESISCGQGTISYISALVRKKRATTTILELIGSLHCRGHHVDLEAANSYRSHQPNATGLMLSNLPGYPFDHAQTYWDEPQIAKNIRLLSPPFNEVLGVPVADWTSLQPGWRNMLKCSSMPWLADHQIHGEVLYPAAAMLVMAIQAIIQVYHDQEFESFELRDVAFMSALAIPPDDEGVEVHFRLTFKTDTTNRSGSWATFSLLSGGENPVEICRGQVKGTGASRSSHGFQDAHEADLEYVKGLITSVDTNCSTEMLGADFYSAFQANGYQYGPTFRLVQTHRRSGNGKEVATISLQQPDSVGTRLVIHPCVLDCILQIAVSPTMPSEDRAVATWLPTYINSLWISAASLQQTGRSESLLIVSTKDQMSARLSSARLQCLDNDNGNVVLDAVGIECTLISSNQGSMEAAPTQKPTRRLCYDLVRLPDESLLTNEQLEAYCRVREAPQMEDQGFNQKLNRFLICAAARTTSLIATTGPELVSLQIEKLLSAYRDIWQAFLQSTPCDAEGTEEYATDSAFESARDALAQTSKLGELYITFTRKIHDMLLGNANAVQRILSDDILREYYKLMNSKAQFLGNLERYLDVRAHKSPRLKILEIGAVVSHVTRTALGTLSKTTSSGVSCRFSEYNFASPYSSSDQGASDWLNTFPTTHVQCFDMELDLSMKEQHDTTYDIILLVNVFHTARLKQKALKNVKRLLKEDGKLILIDITNPMSFHAYSILEYSSLFCQDIHSSEQQQAVVTVPQWNGLLQTSGFTGTDIVFHDCDSEVDRVSSLLISSVEKHAGINGYQNCYHHRRVLLITGCHEPSDSPRAKLLCEQVSNAGIEDCTECSLHAAASMDHIDDCLVILFNGDKWLSLESLDAKEYESLHTVLHRSRYILWFSTNSLDGGLVRGLTRTLRMENSEKRISSVTLDDAFETELATIFEQSLKNFIQGVDTGVYEPETIQMGSHLQIPRVYECDYLNRQIQKFTSKSLEREQRVGDQRIKLRIRQPGFLDSLYFEEIESDELAADEIEVEVKAIGLNFKDCLVALGRVAEDTLGCESAGVVAKAGNACKSLAVGDRVLIFDVDTFQSRHRCLETRALKIPEWMSFTDAAAIGTNYATAYLGLITIGRLQPGESVLIHSGAGGTGQAAIQIAQHFGARVFTTVSSPQKRALVADRYNIPLENILYSRDLSFKQGIMRLTQDRGVDLVFNSLAGDALIASWDCVAPYGRFIEIGKKDIFSHEKLPMFQFARNVSFSAVDLGAMIRDRSWMVRDTLNQVLDLFDGGLVQLPSPMQTFSFGQIEAAFRHLQGGTNFGKVAVEVNADEVIPVSSKPKSSWTLDSEVTFLIAGGLGGQGRSIATWMASKGARHLVLLSRTGPRSEEAKAFIASLENAGVKLYVPSCDITDAGSLATVMEYCKAHLPPIRGCIQAAMDIRDSVFQNLDHDAWTASLRPKVQGSWNLHEQLPRGLDFFILLSSISGVIGSQAQSNYAAGNAYQDALAAFRLGQGEKAVSLDLSLLVGEGYLADSPEAQERFIKLKQVLPMTQDEVMSLLDYFCDKDVPIDKIPSQVVLGLELPNNMRRRGVEPAGWSREPLFANLHQMPASEATEESQVQQKGSGVDVVHGVAKATSRREAGDVVARALASKLGTILSGNQESFDLHEPLHVCGVDSLIAVELRNWLLRTMKADIPIFEILGGATATTLGCSVAEKMRSFA
ncbi:putative polyketide synthase [Xylariaceae sp. FL1272]|nr:putative polyketide synthase [Xylariaceae sp. FL1272]